MFSLLLLTLSWEDEDEDKHKEVDEVSEEDEFNGTSSSCKVILPFEESIMEADVHPHCSLERIEF